MSKAEHKTKVHVFFAVLLYTIITKVMLIVGPVLILFCVIYSVINLCNQNYDFEIPCIIISVLGLFMSGVCFIYYLVVDRKNDELLIYFLKPNVKVGLFAQYLFRYSFRLSYNYIRIGEGLSGIDKVFFIENEGSKILCEELIDKHFFEIISALKESSSESSVNAINEKFKEERELNHVLEYNNILQDEYKETSRDIFPLSVKICLLGCMILGIVRSIVLKDIDPGIFEKNLFNICAVFLLGMEIIEKFIDKKQKAN